MKVAIVHEWLEHYAGSERVLQHLIQCFPESDLFSLVDFLPESARFFLAGRPVRTSFIQRMPFARKKFRLYLGLMPIAIEQFDLTAYDIVISSSHSVAKGLITGPHQTHVSYVHSPMRYAWDLQAQYLREGGLEHGIKSILARWLLHKLRIWDTRTAAGVDVFVANSSFIAQRILKVYRREAVVIPPPVDIGRFVIGSEPREGYLVASRFAPYKRVELIVEAFARMPDRQLIVVGDGPNRPLVERAAAGHANITLLPPISTDALIKFMQRARAFVFAAEEDFGITMVEAQACGTPVIAFGRGGSRDIVVDIDAEAPTGVLFDEQTVASVIQAVERFEACADLFTAAACRQNSMRFSTELFKHRITAVVAEAAACRAGKSQPPSCGLNLYPHEGPQRRSEQAPAFRTMPCNMARHQAAFLAR